MISVAAPLIFNIGHGGKGGAILARYVSGGYFFSQTPDPHFRLAGPFLIRRLIGGGHFRPLANRKKAWRHYPQKKMQNAYGKCRFCKEVCKTSETNRKTITKICKTSKTT